MQLSTVYWVIFTSLLLIFIFLKHEKCKRLERENQTSKIEIEQLKESIDKIMQNTVWLRDRLKTADELISKECKLSKLEADRYRLAFEKALKGSITLSKQLSDLKSQPINKVYEKNESSHLLIEELTKANKRIDWLRSRLKEYEQVDKTVNRTKPSHKASQVVDLPVSIPEKFIALDLETTGLSPASCEIIEIGAILFEALGQEHVTFNVLVKPRKKIPAKITKLTGITNEMVEQDGIEIEDAINQLYEFLGYYPVIAYNAKFDISFVKAAYSQFGLNYKNTTFCALEAARNAYPGLSSYKLENVARALNLDPAGAHRALKDCVLAGLVFVSAKRAIG